MRTFVGIDIPAEIKKKIDVLVYNLSKEIKSPVKWVEKENFHINIKFLDEVPDENVYDIVKTIKESLSEGIEANVEIGDGLIFPNPSSPKIICLRANFSQSLFKVVLEMNKNLEQLPQIPRDFKQFRPHITLGRVKATLNESEKTVVNVIKFRDKFTVNEICLFESQLKSSGPVYVTIERFQM